MPAYKYNAKDPTGKTERGVMEAADTAELYRKLRAKNLTLISCNIFEGTDESRYSLKLPEVSEFCRQLANMTGAGLTIVRTLNIMRESELPQRVKSIYDKLYNQIHNGMTLSEAMKLCSGAFPPLCVDMFAAGEASGQMEQTARKMALHYDKEHRLNSKVSSAMTYPAVLGVVTLGVVIILFTFVLPTFFDLFEGMELPLVTRVLMSISYAITHYWLFFVIGAMLLVLVVKIVLENKQVKLAVDRLKLKLPIIGKLLTIIYTARFARGMSSLYSSGLPLITTLTVSSTLIGNVFIESQFPDVIKEVRNGQTISSAIKAVDGFEKKLSSTIYVGEESGKLAIMLDSVAESYDFEADVATTKLVTLLEPLMIVVMALIVGFVMCAVMLPIFSLYQNIQ